MKRATDIFEWVNNFIPAEFLTKEKESFRVDFYKKDLSKMRDHILRTDYSKLTLFVKGQKGTGKTTALSFLADDEIKEKYHVINFITSDYLEVMDVSITYFLIQLCVKLMDDDTSGKLEDLFRVKIERLVNTYEGRYQEEITRQKSREGELKGSIGVKQPAIFNFMGFFAPELTFELKTLGKANSEYRKVIKESFQTRPDDLQELVDEMLLEFKKNVCPNKQILLIINELDHMRNQEMIKDFFIRDNNYLTNLNCKKVISIPIYLQTETGFLTQKAFTFFLKLQANPLSGNVDNNAIKTNMDFFYEIVDKRAEEKLYDKKAIKLAIDKSGGIIRQFIEILYEAGINARSTRTNFIVEDDVSEAISTLRKNFEEKLVYKDKVSVLKAVKEGHLVPNIKDVEDSVFIDCLLNNLVIYYENDPSWYDVNPLIEDTLKFYGKGN